MYTNKTCRAHKSTYGSLTETNEKNVHKHNDSFNATFKYNI